MIDRLKLFYKHMIMDAKALLRGERRVAEGYRGRTHTKNDGGNDLRAAKAKPVMTMKITGITDGDTGITYTQDEWIKRKNLENG